MIDIDNIAESLLQGGDEFDADEFDKLEDADKLLVVEEYLRNIAGVDGYIIDTIHHVSNNIRRE